jgi:acyl-CoA thioester hydrolase
MSRLFGEDWRWPVRVYWEDTDAGGVVYYANYLKFMERARTEWLRSLGVSQSSLERERGVLFMVLHVEVDYRSPARLDDELIVSCRAAPDGRTSAIFEQDMAFQAKARRCCCGLAGVV